MIPLHRRDFLRSLTLAGAALFSGKLLDAIELDATQPRYPGVVMGPLNKSWRTLYAEHDGHAYRLTVDAPASAFEHMTWREVYDANGDREDFVGNLELIDDLGLSDSWRDDLLEQACEDEKQLRAFARKGGEPREDGEPPTWGDVLAVTDRDLRRFIETHAGSWGTPRKAAELDDNCPDWHDRVGPMHTPEGEAYLEVVELLESLEQEDDAVAKAARDCFEIIEGSSPGNDFHAVYVHSHEDLAILRELLRVAGHDVNIEVS